MLGLNVAYRWIWRGVARTPRRHQRRAKNWRRIEVFERIVDKYGRLTDWEAVSPPYKKNCWDGLARIDVRCCACGEFYDRYLNDLIQGKSMRCRNCYRAGRTADPE